MQKEVDLGLGQQQETNQEEVQHLKEHILVLEKELMDTKERNKELSREFEATEQILKTAIQEHENLEKEDVYLNQTISRLERENATTETEVNQNSATVEWWQNATVFIIHP